ncbi:UDP-glucose 4-epimerase [Arthrobacter sp. PAMC 25486]|uniref:stealth conserved region 3 domain-containing protein n=1 Tax=Arthrobacter sp. PAMC 25486 TaxID=1494608 RepID=UPI000535C38B|nr:stealth conserved region 3 domain-containing protein [Arthrobacter sp. PAMC 25486]AIY02233.1 UDP-glucose 4-epimerase [Arthrobacter sp. PAMC 25486]
MLTRSDVLMHRGRLALVNAGGLTPAQAMVTDLLAVRQVLDACAIEYLLVRGNDERPVLAIDTSLRDLVEQVLTSSFANEPFYARSVDTRKSTVLLADGALAVSPKTRIMRLFRPRVAAAGGLYYGAAWGVQIEWWTFSPSRIDLPLENSLTRRSIDPRDTQRSTVQRYGKSWPTIDNMFIDHVFDIRFDIDMVFSWVDGSAVSYQEARRELEVDAVLGEGDGHESRFRQVDELKYALRSVHLFAPWIRRIFIATDSPAPQWLADHPKVTLVRSREHFPNPSVLPTHNSMAVESQLHHIDGLAEHFLYSNDDMFFGRPLSPELFFTPGGITRFMLSPNRIGLGESDVERSGFENSARVNRKLLWDRFGAFTTHHLEHSAAPLRRSVLAELEQEFAAEFKATAASTFRAAENISVTNSLYHYYALLTGRAIMHKDGRGRYVDTANMAGLADLPHILAQRNADFLCLNDGSFGDAPPEQRRELVTDFLEKYFPFKAPWEK